MDIKEKLKQLPTSSGVYLMKDNMGSIIYVGKAKNLKRRVSQYFLREQKHNKVRAMVEKIADFDYHLTPTEIDALALESNLIKKHQPFYNILLKDGKAFPYIKIDVKNSFPKVEITRRVKNDGAKYFGPYISGVSVHDIVDIINYVFQIRKCKNSFKKNQRECLNYSLGLCSAPCTNKTSKEDYKKIIDEIIDFLNGNDYIVEQKLQEKMKLQAEMENFENAIETRNKLEVLKRIKQRSVANIPKNLSLDAFCFVENYNGCAICVLNVRYGKILGVNNYFAPESSAPEETLPSFIVQYYSSNISAPKEIILSHEIEEIEQIQTILNKKLDIKTPKKGFKKHILDMARTNGSEFLLRKSSLEERKRKETILALETLKEKLNLSKIPNRMECYDISHTGGEEMVASMVVFENGVPNKKEYRKFKIKTVHQIDDFACMKEVLERRILRYKENSPSFSKMPDLFVIDGGKGQLSASIEILKKHNFDVDIISLAEKFEEVYLPNRRDAIMLKRGSPELTMLQRLRDEAHRFAITFHRKLRTKAMIRKWQTFFFFHIFYYENWW